MRFLLDENLQASIARVLSVLGESYGDDFVHIDDIGASGAKDPDIPRLAIDNGGGCLVTVNVRDFGAKKELYEALLAEGLHVCVLRPGKERFTGDQQISMITRHYVRLREMLSSAAKPILTRATWSSLKVRTLEELRSDFGGPRLP